MNSEPWIGIGFDSGVKVLTIQNLQYLIKDTCGVISQTVALKTLSRRFEIILALYLWVKAWNFLDALILAQSFNLWVLTTFPFWIFIDFEPLLRPKYWIKDLWKYWDFWFSGSWEEEFARHTPYFHCFVIISPLKNVFS